MLGVMALATTLLTTVDSLHRRVDIEGWGRV